MSTILWRVLKLFVFNFRCMDPIIQILNFTQFLCSFYKAPLSNLKSISVSSLCIAWSKSLGLEDLYFNKKKQHKT